MSLTDKEALLPIRVEGQRRSSRLTNEAETVQVQSATLAIDDEDGVSRSYIQLKWWTKKRAWSMVIVDTKHRLVANAGPRSQEFRCWKDCTRMMKAKGLWKGELPS